MLADLLGLSPGLAAFTIAACVLAGAVRGFSGFGLSALAMAILDAKPTAQRTAHDDKLLKKLFGDDE